MRGSGDKVLPTRMLVWSCATLSFMATVRGFACTSKPKIAARTRGFPMVGNNLLSSCRGSAVVVPMIDSSSSDMSLSSTYLSSLEGVMSSYHPKVEKKEEDKKKVNVPFPVVLWRFTRPHTLIGSAVAIPCLHLLAAPSSFGLSSSLWSWSLLNSILYAMVPALLMNLYITGLNQITDVSIDQVNKPYLPLPRGDLSVSAAKWVVCLSLLASLWIGGRHPVYGTPGLKVALWGSALLGTIYSLPPFRLKRFPVLAAFCIVAVRGAVINAGFYAHAMAAVFSSSSATRSVLHYLTTDPKCLGCSLFFAVFGIVIALMKDVPDVKGDRIANIRSFSVRLGQTTVFGLMRNLIALLFYAVAAAFAVGALSEKTTTFWLRGVVAAMATVFGYKAHARGHTVNAEDTQQVYKYYMYLWKLFYASYLVLPFAK